MFVPDDFHMSRRKHRDTYPVLVGVIKLLLMPVALVIALFKLSKYE